MLLGARKKNCSISREWRAAALRVGARYIVPLGGEEEGGGAGKREAADGGEAGFAEPGGVFRLAVGAARTRADEHVESEKGGVARGSLIGVENEILNDNLTTGGEGAMDALKERANFVRREHVTDGEDEHEIVIFPER